MGPGKSPLFSEIGILIRVTQRENRGVLPRPDGGLPPGAHSCAVIAQAAESPRAPNPVSVLNPKRRPQSPFSFSPLWSQSLATLTTLSLTTLCLANRSSFGFQNYYGLAFLPEIKNNPTRRPVRCGFLRARGLGNANQEMSQLPLTFTRENCHLHLHSRSPGGCK